MNFGLISLITFFSSHTLALNCEWWQAKVRIHTVQQHERGNSKVAAHERIEHCRESWRSADSIAYKK